MNLWELLEHTGIDAQTTGDLSTVIERVRAVNEAGTGDITYAGPGMTTTASAVFVRHPADVETGGVVLIVDNPRLAITLAARVLYPDYMVNTSLDTDLPDDCYAGRNVTVHGGTRIGEQVVIGSGTVIGWHGFGYEHHDGQILHMPHVGHVVLGDRVEIGALCTIDRGTFTNTVLEDDVKLDNGVHVAHNCRIGARSMLTAHAMLAGSVTLGEDVWVGPGAQLMQGITVGDNVTIGLGAVVLKDVPAGATMVGNPARQIPTRKTQLGVTR